MKINLIYHNSYGFLSEKEWKNNIYSYLSTIRKTNTGKVLLERIDYLNSHSIYIENLSNQKNFQYPHFYHKGNKLIIVIPDTPYFINIPINLY